MEFWGVEVKSGETFEVVLGDEKVLLLSQACLGETNKNKSESVCLHINVEGKKLVLGTLHSERLPQQLLHLVLDKTFTLSHNWKNGSVYFYGYQPSGNTEVDSEEDSEEEEEAIRLPIPNGKQESEKEVEETKKEEKSVAANKNDAKQVTIVEPGKDDEDDSDDYASDESDDSDSMSTDSGSDEDSVGKDMSDDSDEDDYDDSDSDDSDDSDSTSTDSGSDEEGVGKDMSDDSDDGSNEEEETPKKPQSGKKRQNESAIKTPTTDKKARMTPPQKTDENKAAVHVATPQPSKKPDAKTAGKESNQKSPASAADGAHKSCNREPWKRPWFTSVMESLRTFIKPLASQPKFFGLSTTNMIS